MEKYSGLIALVILVILLVIFIKYQANHSQDEEEEEVVQHTVVESSKSPLDLNDDDALVASLVASIELRNETHKNVQVISVRKVG